MRAARIAIMHTWLSTQDEGWFRLGFDHLQVPFTYISTQDAAREPNLKSKYDVILFAPVGRGTQAIINGMPMYGNPLPWRKTSLTPNLGGIDETDDMRPGLGWTGLQNLQKFVKRRRTVHHRRRHNGLCRQSRIYRRRHGEPLVTPSRRRRSPADQDRRCEQPDRLRLRRLARDVLLEWSRLQHQQRCWRTRSALDSTSNRRGTPDDPDVRRDVRRRRFPSRPRESNSGKRRPSPTNNDATRSG
jgi:hypothetical protein